jgi:GrpB-like predicted nucleotidyltransferase (UPF0157 family)
VTGRSAESPDQRRQRLTAEPVEIAPYDPAWPRRFAEERERLRELFPEGLLLRVEHFGSTAVPGLAAKPIVDVLVEVTDLAAVREEVAPRLAALGYDYLWRPTHGDDGEPWYAWFVKRDPASGARTHHVHVVGTGEEFRGHRDRLAFRDWLRAHPEDAAEYERLKRRLAGSAGDRVTYTRSKSEFVERVTARALAAGEQGP